MFYAGLVRSQAVLSVIMQCFAITCVASLLWLILGYSLAFADSIGGIIGGLGKAFFAGVTPDALNGSIPEIVFAVFQMTFAIITPALMVGAYVERVKFQAVLILSGVWLIVVYAPVCHWIWGRRLAQRARNHGLRRWPGGAHDRRRIGACHRCHAGRPPRLSQSGPSAAQSRHDGGGGSAALGRLVRLQRRSQLAADGGAGMAIAATHIAAAAAAATWSAIEWIKFGKASVVGAATGVIAGLATVTPASGFIGPVGSLILGVAAGAVCFFATELGQAAMEDRRLP